MICSVTGLILEPRFGIFCKFFHFWSEWGCPTWSRCRRSRGWGSYHEAIGFKCPLVKLLLLLIVLLVFSFLGTEQYRRYAFRLPPAQRLLLSNPCVLLSISAARRRGIFSWGTGFFLSSGRVHIHPNWDQGGSILASTARSKMTIRHTYGHFAFRKKFTLTLSCERDRTNEINIPG